MQEGGDRMNYPSQIGAMDWLAMVTPVFWVLCFYFALLYFQHLKNGDERLIKQSRLAAVICLALALLVPAMSNIYIITQMMR
jgi:hypothetical protein